MLLAIALFAALSSPAPIPLETEWSRSPVWDDGLAEVAVYDAHRTVYGVQRDFETVMLTVKEEMALKEGVKADPPYEGRDLTTVLKMNLVSRIPTENYAYDYMTSVFVEREDPRVLLKLAQSSQEWCGTTFKEIVAFGGALPRLIFHSYFDGQGDGSVPLPIDRATLPEEQLLLVMRAASRPASGTASGFRVYESLVTNSARAPVPRALSARWGGREEIRTPAGTFVTDRIDLVTEGGAEDTVAMSFWIEAEGRRALVRFVSGDGRSLTLKSITRRAYWQR